MHTYDIQTARSILNRNVELSDTGCWEYKGTLHKITGYGIAHINRMQTTAHRLLYKVMVGDVSEDLHLDHLCRNRSCVNPEHLEPVTFSQNISRSPIALSVINRNRTHCINGHLLSADNIYSPPSRPNKRVCRTCSRRRTKEFLERKRG